MGRRAASALSTAVRCRRNCNTDTMALLLNDFAVGNGSLVDCLLDVDLRLGNLGSFFRERNGDLDVSYRIKIEKLWKKALAKTFDFRMTG